MRFVIALTLLIASALSAGIHVVRYTDAGCTTVNTDKTVGNDECSPAQIGAGKIHCNGDASGSYHSQSWQNSDCTGTVTSDFTHSGSDCVATTVTVFGIKQTVYFKVDCSQFSP